MGEEWLFCFEFAGADLGACLSFFPHSNPTGPRLTFFVSPGLTSGLSGYSRDLVVAISPVQVLEKQDLVFCTMDFPMSL